MAKFNYKFKNIKEIKQILEKKVQKELALIDLEINKKRAEIAEIKILLKTTKANKIDNKSVSAIDLHFLGKYENYLTEQLSIIEKYVMKKMNQRNLKVKELIKKSKETKTFEILEEKHLLQFYEAQNKIEQKEMDEIGIQEYLKG